MTAVDATGHTESQWENFWSSKSQNDGCQTAHVSAFDDESYCENCDSPVHYTGPNDAHGTCNCEEC
jgi:hypothetical protein